MEQIDQKELVRYLKDEHSKKANEVLNTVKDDLRTEQGQLLLRVLGLLTKVNAAKKAQADEKRGKAASPPRQEEEQQENEAPISRQDREQQIVSQVYSVRFQTLITGQSYRESESEIQKQMLGTFIYEHVKMFLDQALMQRGILQPD